MQNNIGEARNSYALTCENGKFSQEDAAAYFGVSVSTYQKWEQGVGKTFNLETLCAIADLYGTSVDYLLRRTSSPRFEPTRHLGRYERELLDTCERLDAAQIDSLVFTAKNFAVANEKNEAGNSKDVEVSGIVASFKE